MVRTIHLSAQWAFPVMIGICLLTVLACARGVSAINQIPTPQPIPGSYGLGAIKMQPPPKVGATITTPANGASFTTSPITVNGICPNDLLVQIYDNGVMVGSVLCKGGSFSLQVSLFAGVNELTAIVYDDLEQAGPTSNTATVTYTDAQFSTPRAQITLTSVYGRRSTPAGSELNWPLQLSGGTGPYAFSIDSGDGSTNQLKSQTLAGLVTFVHVYKKAGIYPVNIKVADVNGSSAFLQVIAVANGKVEKTAAPTDTASKTAPPQIMWVPTALSLAMLIPSFWLGRRSQLVSLQNKMLKERDGYKGK